MVRSGGLTAVVSEQWAGLGFLLPPHPILYIFSLKKLLVIIYTPTRWERNVK